MVKFVKFITRLFLVAFVLGAFSATSFTVTAYAQNVSKQLTSESVIEKIKRRGVVRAGVATFVPWVMRSIAAVPVPAIRNTFRTPSMTPAMMSRELVLTLVKWISPDALSTHTTSVKVPPMSTPMIIARTR